METKDGVSIDPKEKQPQQDRIILSSNEDTVTLKQLIPEDAVRYFNLVNVSREHLSQNGETTALKYPTLDSVKESIANPTPGRIRFGIWDGDTMVGSDNITPLDDQVAELGSWVGKEHAGHHYAARARKLLVDYAFSTLNLRQVFCVITVGNEASRKSVEKSGFQLTTQSEDKLVYTLDNPKIV